MPPSVPLDSNAVVQPCNFQLPAPRDIDVSMLLPCPYRVPLVVMRPLLPRRVFLVLLVCRLRFLLREHLTESLTFRIVVV
jgi:hypothetical protein